MGYGFAQMKNGAPPPSREWCLFLDIDGTLLDIADTPSAVIVDPRLNALLTAVAERLNGAVALVSGRSMESIDRLFAPIVFPAAGQHGAERRSAAGVLSNPGRASDLDGARVRLRDFAESHPGALFEDKGRSIAIHFRLAPELEADAGRAIAEAAAALARYEVQAGSQVLEIKPRGFTKATAAEAFMREPPFSGRTPVFVGDDLTDECGLRFAERMGGISIAVGDRLRGQWHLENPREVRRWLGAIASLPQGRS
jgi:trehalose 6-phosphate phosphatase